MSTKTKVSEVVNKKNLIQTMEILLDLSDRAILQAKDYIERLREEEIEREAYEEEQKYQSMTLDEIKAEIANLKAKHGTTPNDETIAAMKEADAGLCEAITIDELKAEIIALS